MILRTQTMLALALALGAACSGGEEETAVTFTASATATTTAAATTTTAGLTTSGASTDSEGTSGTSAGTSGGESTSTGATSGVSTTGTTDVEPPVVCGDGKVGGLEACDDGNTDNPDDCLDTCVAAACGDGFVQAGVEGCDDANNDNTDDCLDTCAAAECGDGFVQAGAEECDDANDSDADGCLSCVMAKCGDGVVWEGVEACDDGNMVDDDACSNSCAAGSCGDGVVQGGLGEECDDANDVNTDACLDTCKMAKCGDGVVEAGVEACDEGGNNNDNTGPCRTNCTLCDCQGNDVMGKTCADVPGFTCGKLACSGCSYNTSGCKNVPKPNFAGQLGPDFAKDTCWQQCEGYLDNPGGDDVPAAWGNDCVNAAWSRIRIACGASVNQYRYITVEKNVFKDGLAAYPENNLISEAKDQNGVNFSYPGNQIYATGNHPHNGTSWWAGGNGCGETNGNITINNVCSWEASNCFGQNNGGARYLWVYVAPPP